MIPCLRLPPQLRLPWLPIAKLAIRLREGYNMPSPAASEHSLVANIHSLILFPKIASAGRIPLFS